MISNKISFDMIALLSRTLFDLRDIQSELVEQMNFRLVNQMTTDSVPIAWTKGSEQPLVAVISTHANNVKKHSQITQRLNAAVNIQTGKSTHLNTPKLPKTTNNPKLPQLP